jgi:hypothetical protein
MIILIFAALNVPIYIQQDATLHRSFYLETASGGTIMCPCSVRIFQYISKNMQRYTVYLYLETALHVSGGIVWLKYDGTR